MWWNLFTSNLIVDSMILRQLIRRNRAVESIILICVCGVVVRASQVWHSTAPEQAADTENANHTHKEQTQNQNLTACVHTHKQQKMKSQQMRKGSERPCSPSVSALQTHSV
jgi:ABC-type nickel/cobalt efflux system permease component RcnA